MVKIPGRLEKDKGKKLTFLAKFPLLDFRDEGNYEIELLINGKPIKERENMFFDVKRNNKKDKNG